MSPIKIKRKKAHAPATEATLSAANQPQQASVMVKDMRPSAELLRQINPNFIQDGRVSSQAFRPTPKDEGCLSVYDGDLIAPGAAYAHFTDSLGFQSVGVQAVTVAECAALDLPARPDPEPFPEHAVIDFSAFQKKQVEAKAKRLRILADARGWRYGPRSGLEPG